MKNASFDIGLLGARRPCVPDVCPPVLASVGAGPFGWMPLTRIRNSLIGLIEHARSQEWEPGKFRHLAASMRAYLALLWLTMQSNFKNFVKDAMLSDANWRAKVYDDLGGNVAAQAWTQRKEKAEARLRGEMPPAASRNKTRPETAISETAIADTDEDAPQPGGVKTDADGLFRFAIIKTGERGDYMRVPSDGSYNAYEPPMPVIGLIEVTPQDLTKELPQTENTPETLTHIGDFPLSRWRGRAEAEYMYWRIEVHWTISVMQMPRIKAFADRLSAHPGGLLPKDITIDPEPPKALTFKERLEKLETLHPQWREAGMI